MIWRLSDCGDGRALVVAKRHYSHTNPHAAKLGSPARQLVLTAGDGPDAVWMTTWSLPEYTDHAWPGAWNCSLFRRERGDVVASEMIRQAVAVTRWKWPDVPPLGMITMIDRAKVRPTKVRGVDVFGWTYLRAGFELEPIDTVGGLLVLRMRPENMPDAEMPLGATVRLLGAA